MDPDNTESVSDKLKKVCNKVYLNISRKIHLTSNLQHSITDLFVYLSADQTQCKQTLDCIASRLVAAGRIDQQNAILWVASPSMQSLIAAHSTFSNSDYVISPDPIVVNLDSEAVVATPNGHPIPTLMLFSLYSAANQRIRYSGLFKYQLGCIRAKSTEQVRIYHLHSSIESLLPSSTLLQHTAYHTRYFVPFCRVLTWNSMTTVLCVTPFSSAGQRHRRSSYMLLQQYATIRNANRFSRTSQSLRSLRLSKRS